jgi:hypothetical protein
MYLPVVDEASNVLSGHFGELLLEQVLHAGQ